MRRSAETVPDANYRLEPGDTLRVKFPYHPDLDIKMPVRPDGKITLQAAGEVDAAGLTTDELAEVIRQRSGDTLRDPEVHVIISDLGEQGVYVGGEVQNPGFVSYRHGMTALDAIMDRGGFTTTARIDYVVHLMAQQDGYLATHLDLSRALQGDDESVRLAVKDMLYVPRNTIGDINAFINLYLRNILPFPPRANLGFAPGED